MVRISNKHGVNPGIPKCYYCNKDKNQIVLFGKLPNDAEAPHGAVIDLEPCDQCAEYMKMGVILISVRDGETDTVNPYRTGKQCVMAEQWVNRVVTPESMRQTLLKRRVAFIEDKVWEMLELPTKPESE